MLSSLSPTPFPSLLIFFLAFLYFFLFSIFPNIHCIPLKNLILFSFSFLPKSFFCVRTVNSSYPFLPIISISSFMQFPGKRHFQLCISGCPQSASAQLWGADSWRVLHKAFPPMLATVREMVSHSLAERQGALLSLCLQETKRWKLRAIRRENHGVACGSCLVRMDVHGPMEVAGCWTGWLGLRGEWITMFQRADLRPASSCEPLFL